MQILNSNHREFNQKSLLWGEGLWVFNEALGDNFDYQIDTAEKKNEEEGKDSEKLKDPKEIQEEAKREFDNALTQLKSAYENNELKDSDNLTDHEEASLSLYNEKKLYFLSELEDLNSKTDAAKNEASEEKETSEKKAIDSLVTEGNNLLSRIKTRVDAANDMDSTEDDDELIKKDVKEKKDIDNDLKNEFIKNGYKIISDTFGIKEGILNADNMKEVNKKIYKHMVEGKIIDPSTAEVEDLNNPSIIQQIKSGIMLYDIIDDLIKIVEKDPNAKDALQKLQKFREGKESFKKVEESYKKMKESEKILKIKVDERVNELKKDLALDETQDAETINLLNNIKNKIKLTVKQEVGKVELNEEQLKEIRSMVTDALPKTEKYNSNEGEILGGSINSLLPKGINKDSASAIKELFNDDEDSLRQYVSMRHSVESKDGILKIDNKVVKDINDLKQYLPQSAGEKLVKLSDIKDTDKDVKKTIEGLGKELSLDGKNGVDALNNIQKLKDKLKTPEGKEKGMLETIMGLLEAFQAIMAAWKSGDYETMSDVIKDMNEGKNLVTEIRNAKKGYKESFNKEESNVSKLLTAYMNPRGDEASSLLKGENPPQKYRTELKPIISTHLAKGLGMKKIVSIKLLENGDREIRGFDQKGRDIGIELSNKTGEKHEMVGRIVYYKNDKNKDGESIKTMAGSKPLATITSLSNLKVDINDGVKTEEPAQPKKIDKKNTKGTENSNDNKEKKTEKKDDDNKKPKDEIKDSDARKAEGEPKKDKTNKEVSSEESLFGSNENALLNIDFKNILKEAGVDKNAYAKFVYDYQSDNGIPDGEWIDSEVANCRASYVKTLQGEGGDKFSKLKSLIEKEIPSEKTRLANETNKIKGEILKMNHPLGKKISKLLSGMEGKMKPEDFFHVAADVHFQLDEDKRGILTDPDKVVKESVDAQKT